MAHLVNYLLHKMVKIYFKELNLEVGIGRIFSSPAPTPTPGKKFELRLQTPTPQL